MNRLIRYTVCAAIFASALIVFSWCFTAAIRAVTLSDGSQASAFAQIAWLLFGSVAALICSATVTVKSFSRFGFALFAIAVGLFLLASTVRIPR